MDAYENNKNMFLLYLLMSPDCELLNVDVYFVLLQALTCLSEAPEGRKVLLDHVEKVKKKIFKRNIV